MDNSLINIFLIFDYVKMLNINIETIEVYRNNSI